MAADFEGTRAGNLEDYNSKAKNRGFGFGKTSATATCWTEARRDEDEKRTDVQLRKNGSRF